jgi:hypothetical protein
MTLYVSASRAKRVNSMGNAQRCREGVRVVIPGVIVEVEAETSGGNGVMAGNN